MHDHQISHPKNPKWYPAKVVRGYQIASGLSADNPYGAGSLELQLPIFCQQGLPFQNCYAGTLNLELSPNILTWVSYWHCLHDIKWHPQFAAESFAFCPCLLKISDKTVKAFVYYPLPATKIGHFQVPSVVEVIAEFIPDVHYRDTIQVSFPEQYIKIINE
ncbi:hypothetical protein FE810_05610 [Thalassotalea litorea]|uniref:Uncharacterized protein n=1 Tax=Thalassotalea litorea TaxID=2020715 RepID=A0A5R9IP01_9GAMM|nr:hypothetical protein [Thalassotalea litorea]TLU66193.1 hypothetical protein FE810_05610 [Thalassotalea litorea]